MFLVNLAPIARDFPGFLMVGGGLPAQPLPLNGVLTFLSDSQWRWLGMQSLQREKSLSAILAPLTIRIPTDWTTGPDSPGVTLEGMLPCGLYGCVLPDGSSHT